MANDREIIGLFMSRSETAIDALKEKYGRLLFGIAENILKDARDAEEAVSDACLAVWNSIPPENPESLMAYAAIIARNTAAKMYRRNTAIKRNAGYDAALSELSECLPSSTAVEDEIMIKELTGLVNRFLAGEKRENRIVFLRRYWFADDVAYIAKMLGISENNVYVRLARTRKRLKEFLEKEGYSV